MIIMTLMNNGMWKNEHDNNDLHDNEHDNGIMMCHYITKGISEWNKNEWHNWLRTTDEDAMEWQIKAKEPKQLWVMA